MTLRVRLLLCLLLFLTGCTKTSPPTAGGKPIDHWMEAATDADPKVRAEAIEKLGNIGSKAPAAIEAIVQTLGDADPKVRKVALYAVVRNRSSCQSAFPKLKEMSEQDDSKEIRGLATEAHHNLAN